MLTLTNARVKEFTPEHFDCFAPTRCLRNTFLWDNFTHPGPTITATNVIGGPANHSLTTYCPSGSSWTNGGGVFIDDAY